MKKGLCLGLLSGMIGLLYTAVAAAEQPVYCFTPLALSPHVPLQARNPQIKDFSGPLPIADYLEFSVACANRRRPAGSALASSVAPPSAWAAAEHQTYGLALAKHPSDILIVPFQVQGFGLDRIERTLMGADLARALARTSTLSVADPFLVARALGEGLRRYDDESIRKLAEQLGARYIITGFVGHDRQHQMTVTLQVRDQRAPLPRRLTPWQHDWRNLPFTDEQTPAVIWHRMLPEVLGDLPIAQQASAGTTAANPWPARLRVRGSLGHLSAASSSELPAPVALTLLAGLSPIALELPRERLFERAWIAGLYDDDGSAQARFFQAYILMNLTRRPAALALLAQQTTPEANTLRALLDGNLADSETALSKVPDNLARVLLALSVRDLEADYGWKLRTTAKPSAKVFGASLPQWKALFESRSSEDDPWAFVEPALIKALLDESFPLSGSDLHSLVVGNAVAHAEIPDDIGIDLANVRHTRSVTEQLESAACCADKSSAASSWDILWLLEAMGEDRIINSLSQPTRLRGQPSEALERLARYDPLLGGQPDLEIQRADAKLALLYASPDDEHRALEAEARRSATLAAQWLPGQSRTTAAALLDLGIPSDDSLFMLDAYGYDYPRRAFWPKPSLGWDPTGQETQLLLSEALRFSSSDVSLLRYLPDGTQPGQRGALLATLGAPGLRFKGNPLLENLSAPTPAALTVASDATLSRLKKAIAQSPDNWENVKNLGKYLIESGAPPEQALQAFLHYPGFHDRDPQDPVALSNEATEAGSLLYALGLVEFARPLYRIAADLDTGSDASLVAAQRLAVFDGDFATASRIALERGNRYGDANAYRDYLTLLHLSGRSDEAWQAFAQLNTLSMLPQIWMSAFVGLRHQGLSTDEWRAWLVKPDVRNVQLRTRHFAAFVALWNFSADRVPPADLGALIEQIEGAPVARTTDIVMDGLAMTQVPHDLVPDEHALIPSSHFRDGKRGAAAADAPLKSALAFFASAYAALRHADYAGALAAFDAMGDHYRIERYPLAYFAYAAAKLGDPEKLEQYIDQSKELPNFDSWLAKAFFAGARHDADGALKDLRAALRLRPYTDERPVLSEYQYAEACEWLYHDTGDARFVKELLDWARRQQSVQPTFAWIYTMQYQYGPAGDARVRALAMSLFLDPASPRIAKASPAEQDQARAWLAANPPFASIGSDGKLIPHTAT